MVSTVTSVPSAANPLASARNLNEAAAGSGVKILLPMTTFRGLIASTVSRALPR